MLLSDADRERLYEQLSVHAAADRITLDELERRVAAVAAASTREQAAAIVADLPPLPPAEAQGGRRLFGRRYGVADAPSPDWQATNERFRDPESGRLMRVWVDSAGGRHYLADADSG